MAAEPSSTNDLGAGSLVPNDYVLTDDQQIIIIREEEEESNSAKTAAIVIVVLVVLIALCLPFFCRWVK